MDATGSDKKKRPCLIVSTIGSTEKCRVQSADIIDELVKRGV